MKSYLVIHNLDKYKYNDIKTEFEKNGCLEYLFGSADSKNVKVNDIVYIYYCDFNDYREGRILVRGVIVKVDEKSLFLEPVNIRNSNELCYTKLNDISGNKLSVMAKNWLNDELSNYLDNIFKESDIFQLKPLKKSLIIMLVVPKLLVIQRKF